MIKVDRANGVTQFITVKKSDLEIGFDDGGVDGDGLFKLLDRGGVVEVGDILAGLPKEWVTLVLGFGARGGLGAGGEGKGGKESQQGGLLHPHRMSWGRNFASQGFALAVATTSSMVFFLGVIAQLVERLNGIQLFFTMKCVSKMVSVCHTGTTY